VAVLAEIWWIKDEVEFFLKKKEKKVKKILRGWQWRKEWQWLGGSGTVGKRRSGRFEWYRLECGSGSIGRVRYI
jgi:hypothetical protein